LAWLSFPSLSYFAIGYLLVGALVVGFWWPYTLFLRDASMHKDLDDAVDMHDDLNLSEDAAF
jgi:hypothetical protein